MRRDPLRDHGGIVHGESVLEGERARRRAESRVGEERDRRGPGNASQMFDDGTHVVLAQIASAPGFDLHKVLGGAVERSTQANIHPTIPVPPTRAATYPCQAVPGDERGGKGWDQGLAMVKGELVT